jgi:hypothetical protein
VAAWLHAGLVERLSTAAKREIEDSELLLSPMVLLEMHYLYRRKRIAVELPVRGSSIGGNERRLDRRSVRPHHRSAGVGQSRSALITADAEIRRHYKPAVW